jgi:hypothetical protein
MKWHVCIKVERGAVNSRLLSGKFSSQFLVFSSLLSTACRRFGGGQPQKENGWPLANR